MKRWEVTYQLMDGDFPRNHPVYWCVSGVPSRQIDACLGLYGGNAKRTHTISPSLSLSLWIMHHLLRKRREL